MKIRLELEGKNTGSINYKGPDSAEMAAAYLSSIEADNVQVFLVNDDGTKAFAEFEGESPETSAARFIRSTVKTRTVTQESFLSPSISEPGSRLTLKERLGMFLRFEYPRTWFSSLDVKKRYEDVYEEITLSTVSTYLARMYRENMLERRGNRTQREYRIKEEDNPLMNIESASTG